MADEMSYLHTEEYDFEIVDAYARSLVEYSQQEIMYMQAAQVAASANFSGTTMYKLTLEEELAINDITFDGETTYTVYEVNSDGNVVIKDCDGLFEISAAVDAMLSANGTITVSVRKGSTLANSTVILTITADMTASTRKIITTGSKIVELSAGDILYLAVQGSAGSFTAYNGNGMTYLLVKSLELLAPLSPITPISI